MTSQSPRIYIYKITFEEVPYYYYGVHKEKVFGEYYMGTPVTHKWVWDFYTPKKQILEVFPYADEGWIEAQEVEKRLIRPFYNIDKWCLNESCGGKTSLKILRENGKKGQITSKEKGVGIYGMTYKQRLEIAKKNKEEGIGIFAMTYEELSKAGKTGGKKSGKINAENKTGVCGRSKEKMSEDGRKGAQKCKELGIGIFSLSSEELSASAKKAYANGLGKASPEQRSEWGRDVMSKLSPEQKSENGRKGAQKCKELGLGIFVLTKEQLSEAGKKAVSQKWMCLETGYVSTAAGVVSYQKGRGIDTSKENRRRIP